MCRNQSLSLAFDWPLKRINSRAWRFPLLALSSRLVFKLTGEYSSKSEQTLLKLTRLKKLTRFCHWAKSTGQKHGLALNKRYRVTGHPVECPLLKRGCDFDRLFLLEIVTPISKVEERLSRLRGRSGTLYRLKMTLTSLLDQ